jgi:electron transfer flavoprotein beta subunit
VLLVTIGPAAAEQQLRTGLAMGADRAIRVDAPDELEPLTVARALHALALRERPGLVVLGKQAVDADHGQTGQMLASLWDRPQATFASELVVAAGVATVTREVDAGLETLEVDLPAVVTTDLRLNQPRYVKLPEILKAKSKPLAVVSLGELGVAVDRQFAVHDFASPGARGPGVRVNDVAELIATLDARGALS